MVNLTCIVKECGDVLEPVGKGEQNSTYIVRYFSCKKCHTRHYLPIFEGVELKLEDYQESLMLNDPLDGRIERKS